jgi:hypothetical protein
MMMTRPAAVGDYELGVSRARSHGRGIATYCEVQAMRALELKLGLLHTRLSHVWWFWVGLATFLPEALRG